MSQRIDNFDQELAGHLGGLLDPQLGRGRRAVAEIPRRRNHWRTGVITAAATALAACLAVFLLMRGGNGPTLSSPKPEIVTAPPAPAPAGEPQFAQFVRQRVVDDGPQFLGDNVPVRRYRRQQMQTTWWYDPATNRSVETRVPYEQVVYVVIPIN